MQYVPLDYNFLKVQTKSFVFKASKIYQIVFNINCIASLYMLLCNIKEISMASASYTVSKRTLFWAIQISMTSL